MRELIVEHHDQIHEEVDYGPQMGRRCREEKVFKKLRERTKKE